MTMFHGHNKVILRNSVSCHVLCGATDARTGIALIMHRIVILAIFLLLLISAIGFENQGIFPGPFLAVLGILVVLSCLASPILVFYSVKDLLSIGVNRETMSYLVLSVIYIILVILGIYKIWPQLMSV